MYVCINFIFKKGRACDLTGSSAGTVKLWFYKK